MRSGFLIIYKNATRLPVPQNIFSTMLPFSQSILKPLIIFTI